MEKPPVDEIELAARLFGPKVAERLRKLRERATPTRVEVDPATGRRVYSHSDE